MNHQEEQLIRKWCKLRTPDGSKRFISITIDYFRTLDENDRKKMLTEFKDYIFKVKNGILQPGPIEIQIPKY